MRDLRYELVRRLFKLRPPRAPPASSGGRTSAPRCPTAWCCSPITTSPTATSTHHSCSCAVRTDVARSSGWSPAPSPTKDSRSWSRAAVALRARAGSSIVRSGPRPTTVATRWRGCASSRSTRDDSPRSAAPISVTYNSRSRRNRRPICSRQCSRSPRRTPTTSCGPPTGCWRWRRRSAGRRRRTATLLPDSASSTVDATASTSA